jgi:hypothetical protein
MESNELAAFHEHRGRVRDHLNPAIHNLMRRGSVHDLHKLDPVRAELEPFSSYEPEAHTNGIRDMTLLDILELLAEIRAVSEVMRDKSCARCLEVFLLNYKVPEDIAGLMRRSAIEFFWAQADELTEVRKLLVDAAPARP